MSFLQVSFFIVPTEARMRRVSTVPMSDESGHWQGDADKSLLEFSKHHRLDRLWRVQL